MNHPPAVTSLAQHLGCVNVRSAEHEDKTTRVRHGCSHRELSWCAKHSQSTDHRLSSWRSLVVEFALYPINSPGPIRQQNEKVFTRRLDWNDKPLTPLTFMRGRVHWRAGREPQSQNIPPCTQDRRLIFYCLALTKKLSFGIGSRRLTRHAAPKHGHSMPLGKEIFLDIMEILEQPRIGGDWTHLQFLRKPCLKGTWQLP